MKYKGLIVVGIISMVGITMGGCPLITYGNREADLRTRIEASEKSNQVVFDRVWKTIQQQAGVANKYQESFKEIYVDIMQARNPGGESKLAKFIQEANPNFDSSLFKQLMTSIEANRRDFEREQKTLIDLGAEHNVMFRKFPSSVYLTVLGRREIQVGVVTSSRTEEAFQSGKDDNVEMFK